MQIRISARHGHLSEATQEKITAKVEKLLRYFDRVTEIEVTVDLEHKESILVELQLDAEHKHDFVARDQSADLMVSVDHVVHKVEQQLRKYKDKVQSHRGPGLGQASLPETTPVDEEEVDFE